MILFIIYLVLIIPSYAITRSILRGDHQEDYDWTGVLTCLIVSVFWTISLIIVIVSLIIVIVGAIVHYFKNSNPPKWL